MSWSSRFKKLKKLINKNEQNDIEFFNETNKDKETTGPEVEPEKKGFWKKTKPKKSDETPSIKDKPANRNIFMNFRRRNTLQIIKYLENKNIFNCFFYTDVSNISLILEQGIKPTGSIKLLTRQEYVVWTYLEHATYLELELGNSTRHFFWKWCTENNVDLNKLAIISVDINKLFQGTSKDWGLNLDTNRIQIYEMIPISAIDWMLIKDKKMFRLAQMYIEKQNLKIKLFQSNEG